MSPQAVTRRFATILFTDIVGSTDIARELGDGRWRELVRRHHAIEIDPLTLRVGRTIEIDPLTLRVGRTIEIGDASILRLTVDGTDGAIWLDFATSAIR